ncbi:vitamin K epoxide reductase family protein [Nakamurella alba]|uniref:vitamin K epoxide reductase family protein n=1 Tax=Nakamurella alba TaxID=2665158 RepID=UPI0018AACB67|nr:vitamin K epoxide reductase family protein [Nakamurella alba]
MNRSRAAWACFVLCVIGFLLSGYLSYEHFTGSASLLCGEGSTVNCLAVTTSSWATVLGVPVAVAGLAYFVAMTLLCLPVGFNRDTGTLRLIGAGVGVLSVLYLVGVELFAVHAICLWCTGVHLVTLLLFAGVLWWRAADRRALVH